VLNLGLNILIIACSLIGIVVCAMGTKTKNILYKGGVYFFLLFFIERIYSLIVPIFISRLIEQGIDKPGLLVRNSTILPLILMAVALVIFIIYLFKGLNESSCN
jgi:hypothetical protein